MKYGLGKHGLGYVVRQSSGEVAYCSLSINGGTRAEMELPEGTAHFVEHALFRGTEDKSASKINSCLDRLGGELNAYTTKEEIVLHATVLKEDLDKAASLLLELASRATFPEAEIETERGVIRDEIISCLDSPSDDIYDRFESSYFEGSSLSRLILGTRESVESISRKELNAFYRKYFVPSNMVLSIVAPFAEDELTGKALELEDRYFHQPSTAPLFTSPIPAEEKSQVHGFELVQDKGIHEANSVIGAVAPSLYGKQERISTILLTNILGGPASNSLLGEEIRERRGLVYGIECAYTQYRDRGLVSISFGCEKNNLKHCIKLINRTLDRVCTKPFSERTLNAYKRQLLGQLAISADSGEAQCLSMGKSLLSFGEVVPESTTREQIEAISAEYLRSCAEKIFHSGHSSCLIYI